MTALIGNAEKWALVIQSSQRKMDVENRASLSPVRTCKSK